MHKTVIAMPVGPLKIGIETAQMIGALMYKRAIGGLFLAEGHLITARNGAWAGAVERKAMRVIWCDADVSADAEQLIEWCEENEKIMAGADKIGCISAVVARRGGGWAFNPDGPEGGPLLGLGLSYWHLPRVLTALTASGRDPLQPFRWVPPWGEDFDISMLLARHGAWQAINPKLPTRHDGVGIWSGGKKLPGHGSEASIGKIKP